MYDPHAMAIAGRLYLAAATGEEAEPLVQSVAEFPASAPAFLRHRGTLDKIDKKLLISICRVALLACVISRRANYDDERTGTAWLRFLKSLGSNTASTSQSVLLAHQDGLLETNRQGEDGEDNSDIERIWTRGLKGLPCGLLAVHLGVELP